MRGDGADGMQHMDAMGRVNGLWVSRGWAALALAGALAVVAMRATAAVEPADPPAPRVDIEASVEDDELVLDFSEPMQILSNRIEPGLLRMRPAVGDGALRCAWEDDTRLSCAMAGDAPIPPATAYRIELAAGLRSQAGAAVPAQVLRAATDPPELHARVAWIDGQPRIDVYGYQTMALDEVARVLRLRIDGRDFAPRLERLSDHDDHYGDERTAYRLRLPAIDTPAAPVELSVVPGLRSSDGPLRGEQRLTLVKLILNEPFRLVGAACARRDGVLSRTPVDGRIELECLPDEAVQLVFSQPLQPAARASWIAAWPSGLQLYSQREWGFRALQEVERESGEAIALGRDRARDGFELNVAGLRSQRGAEIQPTTLRVRTLDYRPVLRGAHSSGLIADPAKPPVLVEAVDAAPGQWPLRGLDEVWTQGLQTGPARRSAHPVPLRSQQAEEVLARGGWVGWYPTAYDGDTAREQAAQPLVEVSAPGFDLFATQVNRQVLAWAQGWQDGAAVTGAEIELLLQTPGAAPVSIARARTGADGLARLRVPDAVAAPTRAAYEDDGRRLILRATDGRGAGARRAVLPADRWFSAGALRKNAETLVWGVADKPLYRASENVRYKLWLREKSGERLLRPRADQAATLRLTGENETATILSWPQSFDAHGALDGERRLPSQLPDGRYCIRADETYRAQGACFFVGTFRAQDLWAQASSEDRVLRDGERFAFELSAGYYSGGAAAGLEVDRVTAMLMPLPLSQAYPRYADYQFIEPAAGSTRGRELPGARELKLRTDAQGRARAELTLDFAQADRDELPPFGRLQAVASVRLADREGTASNAAQARYSRYRRFVGLRSDPSWFDARSPIRLQAVVIDENGVAQDDAPVEVDVRWLPGWDENAADADAPVLHRCSLRPGQATACDFPREKTGRYLLTARSGDAAPARLSRYVWAGDSGARSGEVEPALELIRAASLGDRRIQVQLRQPYAKAHVLLAFEDGREWMGARVEAIEGQVNVLTLSLPDTRARSYALVAHVRDAAAPKIDAQGWRTPASRTQVSLNVVPPRAAEAAPLSLSFATPRARPGERVRLRLHNGGAQPLEVALSVMDDALRSLAGKDWASFDPQHEHWLGGLEQHRSIASAASFARFRGGSWKLALPGQGETRPPLWPQVLFDPAAALPSGAPYSGAAVPSSDDDASAGAAASEADAAASVADAAASGGGYLDQCPNCSVVPVYRYTEITGSRPDVAYAPPPAPKALPMAPADREQSDPSTSLDRIEVTGSRVGIEDVFAPGEGRGGDRPARAPSTEPASALRVEARVRTRFVDTVHWLPRLQLAAGESREIELDLPDNLTRWRAVAWSNDADDGFRMSEATLEVGLPLEARLQTPVRLYPGDRSRLAGNARRSAEAAVEVDAQLRVDAVQDAGADAVPAEAPMQTQARVALAAHGQGAFALEIAPQRVGSLRATAQVQAGADRDAVAAPIEVATPLIAARRTQAGWLGAQPLTLAMPALPDGASQAHLQVSLLRGSAALVDGWTADLHAYPHRCWEQILSRGVAAALSLQRDDSTPWPQDEARAAVREAIDNAGVFQNEEGDFSYFTSAGQNRYASQPDPAIALSAYSVRALSLLERLGHPVEGSVLKRARAFVARVGASVPKTGDSDAAGKLNDAAIAAGAIERPEAGQLDPLWAQWARLYLPARIDLIRAMARSGHADTAQALARVLDSTRRRGEARTLSGGARLDRWMSSDLREQCALIGLLREFPALGDRALRRGLIAGLSDLYAGGVAAVDTQTGAYCLWALSEDSRNDLARPVSASVELGARRDEIVLAPGATRGDWQAPLPPGLSLRLAAHTGAAAAGSDAPLSYAAIIDYQEDARRAVAHAVGLSIERRFEVLRDGAWRPLAGAGLRENDWVRVTLVVRNGAERYFVALTDAAPGGLFPTDLSLSGIAGLDLEQVSDTGSGEFETRRLDPRTPRFYAQRLSPGTHEVHYFARAGNAGDYLAAPARLELMYGSATQARTAAERVTILPARGGGE